MATPSTAEANDVVHALLDFSDERERVFATHGPIAAPEKLEILGEDGRAVWNQAAYSFMENDDGTPAKASETAIPSLWRNTH